MSTVIRGSRRTFFARCRCGSVFTSTCSPSVSTHVSRACGWPLGIRVTTVARFLPWARRTVSSSRGIGSPHLLIRLAPPDLPSCHCCRGGQRLAAWRYPSVAVHGNDHGPGDRVEPEVEPGYRGGGVGVDAQ